MSVPQAVFGPGILIVTRTDLTTPAAINVGYVQELTLDFAGTTKQLYGQNQFPLIAARSTIKATGKWKAATASLISFNNTFYGGTLSTAGTVTWTVASTYSFSTSAGNPFNSSGGVQIGSSLTFAQDLGVTYAASGLPFQRVATGAESSGKYSIMSTSTGGGGGAYNFSINDISPQGAANTVAIKVTYTNTSSATSPQNLVVANQPIGFTPTFRLDYYTTLNQPTAKPMVVQVFQCVAAKHTLAFKLEDFMMPEMDFDIFADNSGNVIGYHFPEIA